MNRTEYKKRLEFYNGNNRKVISLVPRDGISEEKQEFLEEVITEIDFTPNMFYQASDWKTKNKKLNIFGKSITLTPASATVISDAGGVETVSAPEITQEKSIIMVKNMSMPVVSAYNGKILFKVLSNTGMFIQKSYTISRDVDLLVQQEFVADMSRKPEDQKYTNPNTMEMNLFKKRLELQKHAYQIVDTKLRKSAIKILGLPDLMLGDENAVLFVPKYVFNTKNNQIRNALLYAGLSSQQNGLPIKNNQSLPEPVVNEVIEDEFNENFVDTVIIDSDTDTDSESNSIEKEEKSLESVIDSWLNSDIDREPYSQNFVKACLDSKQNDKVYENINKFYKCLTAKIRDNSLLAFAAANLNGIKDVKLGMSVVESNLDNKDALIQIIKSKTDWLNGEI